MKAKKSPKAHCHDAESSHPDHTPSLPRLKRIQGQLGGIEEMIRDGRYCVDILIQFRAAMSALRNLEAEIFESHLRHCVSEAIRSKDPSKADQKILELTELLARRTQV